MAPAPAGSWSDVLREGCLAIHFGFRVPEIVWEERPGLVAVADLASRNPELLERWQYDERGRLVGYVYAGSRPTGKGLEDRAGSGVFERVSIPLEKTVHFVFD